MDSTDTSSMVEDLDDALDDLEFALKPLLTEDMANQLPVLERSKLYVLTVYAIESIIFCASPTRVPLPSRLLSLTALAYLRVNGIQAKEHPVFRELARVKQYFEKIKATEFSEEKPNLRLDRPAAGRLLKHALVCVPPDIEGCDLADHTFEKAEKSYKSKRQAEPEQPAQVQDSDRPSKKPRSNKDQR